MKKKKKMKAAKWRSKLLLEKFSRLTKNKKWFSTKDENKDLREIKISVDRAGLFHDSLALENITTKEDNIINHLKAVISVI